MGVTQHPSAGLREAYAVGDLSPAASLAVSTHLEFCERCTLAVSVPGRHIRALGRIMAVQGASDVPPTPAAADQREQPLPATLGHVARSRWRWAGPGVRAAELEAVCGLAERGFLLRLRAGARITLPSAADVLVLLAGVLEAPEGPLAPGDLLELPGRPARMMSPQSTTGALALVTGDDRLFQRPLLTWLLGRG